LPRSRQILLQNLPVTINWMDYLEIFRIWSRKIFYKKQKVVVVVPLIH